VTAIPNCVAFSSTTFCLHGTRRTAPSARSCSPAYSSASKRTSWSPETFARKFCTKREADAIAHRLAAGDHGSSGSRRNYGAQRETTWNIRLANGAEVHNTRQLEELGLAIPPPGDQPMVGGVKVVAVPREGWMRLFEYVPLGSGDGRLPRACHIFGGGGPVSAGGVGAHRPPFGSIALDQPAPRLAVARSEC
jgi:hypothetical protein